MDLTTFHLLDLNFLSPAEYTSPHNMARFGPTKELYVALGTRADAVTEHDETAVLPGNQFTAADPDETKVWVAMHFTHKAIRNALRGRAGTSDLETNATRLKTVLADYPGGVPTPRGDICPIARAFLRSAENILQSSHDG